MKNIISILFLTFITTSNLVLSQNLTVCLGQDRTVCPGQTVTINDCSNIGGGPSAGSAPYVITNISYTPDPFNIGTSINLSDDAVSSAYNIGFSFCFFGNTYTQFYVGSNGWVSFTGGQPSAYTSSTIPSTGASVPKNCIMSPWQDWHPGTGSNVGNYIKYQVYGTAPFRRLVVSWNACPMFSCTSSLGTFQIVLFETSNNIETRIQNKPNCTGWAGGTAVHGLHNLAGNVAVVVPGRNSTQWTATNEAKRFSPGTMWANTLGQSFPYNNGSLSVAPVPPGTTGYFLKAGCGSGSGGAISDTTWLTLGNPTVAATAVNDVCSQGIGSVTAIPGPGSPAPYTFAWTPAGSTQTLSNLSAGTYTVNMTDGNGCTASASAVVSDNPVSFSTSSTQETCDGSSDGTATAIVTPIDANTTFLWSDGQTTQVAVGLVAGTYTCIATTGGGCTGNLTVTITTIPGMVLSIANQTNVTCNSAANGTATINVSQGTSPYLYAWNASSSTTASANDLDAGINTLTVTDANGCFQNIDVSITEPNPLSIVSHTPDTQICPGASITLNVLGTGGSSPYTYTWEKNGTVIGTGTSLVVTPTTASTQYCVRLTEQCGSPSTQQCMMITHPTPIIPSVVPDKPEDCVPGNFTFLNTSTNGAEIATTEYFFSNGSQYNANGSSDVNGTFPTVGVYDVIMTTTSIYGCVYSDTVPTIIEVNPLPIANFTLSKNPLSWFETNVLTSDVSTGTIASWEWSNPDAVNISSNGSSASFTFPEGVEGTYPVRLIVTTLDGCQDTITINVEVVSDVIMYIPNSFTPDGDEHNQNWKIYLNGIDFQNFTVEIYNRWGEIIWESHDVEATWDGTYGNKKAQQGAYFWKISYKEKNSDGRSFHTGFLNLLR